MSGMVRTVASAIAHVDGCDLEIAISEREIYEIKARAAIEAMWTPTEAMLAAGDSQMPLLEAPLTGRDVLADAWPDMIAAALSEGQSPGPG